MVLLYTITQVRLSVNYYKADRLYSTLLYLLTNFSWYPECRFAALPYSQFPENKNPTDINTSGV